MHVGKLMLEALTCVTYMRTQYVSTVSAVRGVYFGGVDQRGSCSVHLIVQRTRVCSTVMLY